MSKHTRWRALIMGLVVILGLFVFASPAAAFAAPDTATQFADDSTGGCGHAVPVTTVQCAVTKPPPGTLEGQVMGSNAGVLSATWNALSDTGHQIVSHTAAVATAGWAPFAFLGLLAVAMAVAKTKTGHAFPIKATARALRALGIDINEDGFRTGTERGKWTDAATDRGYLAVMPDTEVGSGRGHTRGRFAHSSKSFAPAGFRSNLVGTAA